MPYHIKLILKAYRDSHILKYLYIRICKDILVNINSYMSHMYQGMVALTTSWIYLMIYLIYMYIM